MPASSSALKTFPVGLLGVFRMRARVRGPKALASRSRSRGSPTGSGTVTGRAPQSTASGP